jgi:hypothetical protein
MKMLLLISGEASFSTSDGSIFKMAHLPLKTLIRKKNVRILKKSENAASTLTVTRRAQLLFTFKRKEQK